jgi:hypothetical protein
VVFGSNNKRYSTAEVQAFHAYVDAGGSALFHSDANWGTVWGAAPNSDNDFLLRYGAEVYQDNGTAVFARTEPGRFLIPDHPYLSGTDGAGGNHDVNQFDGEGISPFRVFQGSDGYQAVRLVSADGLAVRLNTPDGSPGQLQLAGPADCVAFLVERGQRRVAGVIDRNTFFNQGGVGSSLFRFDNRQLALNLFRWLAAEPARAMARGMGCGLAATPTLQASPPVVGLPLQLAVQGSSPLAPGLLLLAVGPALPTPLPGGCVLQVDPAAALFVIVGPASSGSGAWQLGIPLPDRHALSSAVVTTQVLFVVQGGPLFGLGELSGGQELTLGYPR